MVAFKLFLAVTANQLVAAWPEPTAAAYLNNRAIDCSKLTGCLGVLKKIGPAATTFCSSYLKIPQAKTSTTTITPTAVTKLTSTTTVTVTSVSCNQQKRDTPNIVWGTLNGLEYSRVGDLERRTDGRDVLPLLKAFAAAKISEGCSCLNLQPKVTKIATLTVPVPTVNVVVTSIQCVVAQPVCNPVDAYCDLFDPGACCNKTCLNVPPYDNPDGKCL